MPHSARAHPPGDWPDPAEIPWRDLRPLMQPRTVAVVGASQREARGNIVLRNLIGLGFPGGIFPINPKYTEVLGLPCYPDLSATPEPVECVVVAIPARNIPDLLASAADLGVRAAPHTAWADGGRGAEELARLVLDATKASSAKARLLYKDEDPFEEKVAKIATEVYGAASVKYDAAALEDLERMRNAGLDRLPVCIAKTQLSLSDDETVRGAPTGWTLEVRGVRPSAGAGFLVAIAGDIMRMPGLGAEPAALRMDVDERGTVTGLF